MIGSNNCRRKLLSKVVLVFFFPIACLTCLNLEVSCPRNHNSVQNGFKFFLIMIDYEVYWAYY